MTKDRGFSKVQEGWTGPGRRDSVITPLKPEEDGLHVGLATKGAYEWWYFDAHLETGHTVVVFFYRANPNPGMAGKIGVEIVIVRPDGHRVRTFVPYAKSDFSANADAPDVRIGGNYIRAKQGEGGLPVYEIYLKEEGLGCHLTYRAEVNGWKPGTGLSNFGTMGYFAWVIPFARASVAGTITDGERKITVNGIGYHDHNWLNFNFARVIDYWMWGRVYSKNFTLSYAFIQCNGKMDRHAVKVLMLAEGKEVILSTGDFDFITEEFEYNPVAKHRYPRKVTIRVGGELEVTLDVKKVMEAQDMLENFNPLLRFIAGKIMRLKPGYFRLVSDFAIRVTRLGNMNVEKGTTLHEIVLFKSAG
jgi:hypothetical protein